MAIASGPASPVLAGPVFTFAFKIAHAQTIARRDRSATTNIINNNYALSITGAARVTAAAISSSSTSGSDSCSKYKKTNVSRRFEKVPFRAVIH